MNAVASILEGMKGSDALVLLVVSLVQIGAGLVVGAILWRPRRRRGIHIPPHRQFWK